jgi:RNA polymerase sigma factor for flagellar operon FliA
MKTNAHPKRASEADGRKRTKRNAPTTATPGELVQRHLPLVDRVAKELHRRSPEFEVRELVGYGWEGLRKAAEAYDPTQGVPFEAFAYHRVRGSMQDGIRQLTGYNQVLRERHRAEEALERCRERQEQLSETMERLAAMLDKFPVPRRTSVMEADRVPDSGRSPETQVHLARIAEQVREALQDLQTQERGIVQGVFWKGRTLQEEGDRLGVSKSWASRQQTRALEQMKGRLASLASRGAAASPRVPPSKTTK